MDFGVKTMKRIPNVAFICVHNSCRSQIAEALGKKLCADIFESFSAGTETKPKINQDAVRLMKRIYGIDMERTQYSKLLEELPEIDIVITMDAMYNVRSCLENIGRIGSSMTQVVRKIQRFCIPWIALRKSCWI